MKSVSLLSPSDAEIKRALEDSLAGEKLSRVLLIPPDMTRLYSGAGRITSLLYRLLCESCTVDILPALGTHDPMSAEERRRFFGDIPDDRFLVHNWREDIVDVGTVPGAFVSEVSEGLMCDDIPVQLNHRLIDGGYDRIISIGQVVPHEVVGMANYTKNLLVGCGGSAMINSSHMLGAVYGMERIMGRDFSPVRRVFDYAQEHFLKELPLTYILTVTTEERGETIFHGLFIGSERSLFERAVALSQKKNLIFMDEPIERAVVYLDPAEFKSTWLGNKAIYRTRMAIADGGELIVLAPGVQKFGEDPENDRLIRKYGYVGRERILSLWRENADLHANSSTAAHLIHGSSDGRFSVTYAVKKLTRAEVEGVGFNYADYDAMTEKYHPAVLTDGYNTLPDGSRIFYISNPALGLWSCGF